MCDFDLEEEINQLELKELFKILRKQLPKDWSWNYEFEKSDEEIIGAMIYRLIGSEYD